MMRRLLLLAVWLPSALLAQLQLSTLVGLNDVETPVTGLSLDIGTGAVGNPTDVRMRLRNTGTANVSLSALRITGSGFSLQGTPSLPWLVVPQANVDFTLHFNPASPGAYTATLIVNSSNYLILASAAPTAQVGIRDGTSTVTLATDTPYDFGQIERGSSVTHHFIIRNPANVAISVGALTLTGTAFRWTGAPTAPLTLAAQQEVGFDITCAPTLAGVVQGTLIVDQLTFRLNAFSVEPAFPRPIIEIDRATAASGQQVKVSVRLSSASKVTGEGTLVVDVSALSSGLPDDSGIQFTASGQRSIKFQVQQGDTQAKFNGQPSATLQTGTIAGSLRLAAQLGGYNELFALSLATALPSIDTATTSHTDSSLQIQVAGFDNTRSLSQLAFTFYDVTGTALPSGTMRLDAGQIFSDYFHTSNAGGLFLLQAVFPVTGGTSLIGSVEVELTSSAGSQRTERIRF